MKQTMHVKFWQKLKNHHYRIMKRIRAKRLVSLVKESPCQEGIMHPSRQERIIISLATYPPRFATIDMSLKSLLLQSMKPDLIIVWIPCKRAELPAHMREFETYGITFREAPRNFHSHLKYFYALQEFPNDIVITVDDDAIYPPDLVQTLVQTHRKHPACICARRVHQITWDENGKIKPYTQWHWIQRSVRKPSFELFAVGVGGVLYPPHSLQIDPESHTLFTKLCPWQDDIWLKWMETLQGFRIVWAPNTIPDPPCVEKSQLVSLKEKNVQRGGNDRAIKALSDCFGPITPSGIICH